MNNNIFQLHLQKQSHVFSVYSFIHSHSFLALFFIIVFIQTSSPATAQFVVGTEVDPNTNNKSSVFAVLAIVVILFFISGFLSLFSRQCAGGRTRTLSRINLALHTGDRSRSESRGLKQEIIDTFPTFLYSNVKSLKIGKETLACAVCLNEFQDDETLRLIPNCNHVFHPSCIDVWLSSHSTCPVCRANLVPRSEDTPQTVSIHIPNEEEETITNEENIKRENNDVESPKMNLFHRSQTMNQSRPTRSRSTRFLFNLLFPRSHSTDRHFGERFERYTLRLPDEVLNSTLKRANSCVNFRRMSSGRKGFRTRSLGSGSERSYFESEEQWRFSTMMPFITMNNWNRLSRKSSERSSVMMLDDNVGERSSDLMCPK
ncbi:putative transcription factor C2H2 family [Lupinus albus]|uniref:RING-type E3 ubiquitin transferase n=1 Tax=Lupinus albus TaxID=3870 RepID=A0A6A4PXA9_LUPAL|nr:putative transcription factor C2H2 family [Lupinus albus]